MALLSANPELPTSSLALYNLVSKGPVMAEHYRSARKGAVRCPLWVGWATAGGPRDIAMPVLPAYGRLEQRKLCHPGPQAWKWDVLACDSLQVHATCGVTC